MDPTAPPAGQIVTFYSYKGGSGRTMAVANVAWILASAGKRVLAIDWDLEAPGLHKYLHPFLADKDLRRSPGVIDLMLAYSSAELSRDESTVLADLQRKHADVARYVRPVRWPFEGGGLLDFMPAGEQNADYADSVRKFDWNSLFARQEGATFIEALKASLRTSYDYVLIDSRTGLNDSAGICTLSMPDTVVNCFTLSAQSIDGAVSVARTIKNHKTRGDKIRIVPVPSRIEAGETPKLEAGRDLSRKEFAEFVSGMSAEEESEYWSQIEIPYKTFFAYEEILAPFGERPRQPNSILSACEKIAEVVTNGEVTELRGVDEVDRRRVLQRFERGRYVRVHDILISYHSVHRTWAEWVSAELEDAGQSVHLQAIDHIAGEAALDELVGISESAGRTIVLLSQAYARAPLAEAFWRAVTAKESPLGPRRLFPIKLDSVTLRPPYTDRSPIDFFETEESQARDELRATLALEVSGESRQFNRPRFPATPPPVWRMRPQRGTSFVGRAKELEDLRDRLSVDVTVMTPQALYGLGGVGKTQIAIEYAYRFAADYDVVWWISAEDLSTARLDLASLAPKLDVAQGSNLDETILGVLEALRLGRPYRRWLLIFDNAEGPSPEFKALVPAQGPGHVLITSRDKEWLLSNPAVEIDVFSRDESVQLLSNQIPGLSQADAGRIAEKLGNLPIALEQAVAWFKITPTSVDDYLNLLEAQPAEVLDRIEAPGYPRTAYATWKLSLDKLRERSAPAAILLELCSFLAPEPIPSVMLSSDSFTAVMKSYDSQLIDPLLQNQLIRRIGNYALAQVDANTNDLQMHRLVRAVIGNQIPEERRETMRMHARELVAGANPKEPDRRSRWDLYASLWPHARATDLVNSTAENSRYMVVDLMRYLYQRGDFASCRVLAREAINTWTEKFGEVDLFVLRARYNLANALHDLGQYAEARETNEDLMQKFSDHPDVGEDHLYTYLTARSLARDLRVAGEYQAAHQLDARSLAWFITNFTAEDSRTLVAENNLSVSLRLLGLFAEAAERDEHIYHTSLQMYGSENYLTLLSASNYGRDLRDIGELTRSQDILSKTLEIQRKIRGATHPETLRTMKYLALTYRQLGQFASAHEIITEAVATYDRTHIANHVDLLAARLILASTTSARGDNEGALAIATNVLTKLVQVLGGENHPLIDACKNNVAIFQRKSHRVEESIAISRVVYERFTQALGSEHPNTLAAATGLSNDLYALGQFAEARALDEQTLERMTARLGVNHPDTYGAGINLGLSLRACGEDERANAVTADAIEGIVNTFGPDSPAAVSARAGERSNCYVEPPPA